MDNTIKIKPYILVIFFLGIFSSFINIRLGLTMLLFFICFYNVLIRKEDIFKPSNYFKAWYFYYFGFGNICYHIRAYFGLIEKYSEKIQNEGLIIAVVFILLLQLLLTKTTNKKIIVQKNVNIIFIKFNLPLILFFVITQSLLMFLFWYKLGGIPLFIKGYHDSKKATLGTGLGYFEYLISFLQYPYLMCIMAYYCKSKKDKLLKILCFFVYYIILPILNDSRSAMLNNLIMVFIFYSWNKRRIPFKFLIVSGIALVFLATVWGIFRSGNVASGSIILLLEIAVEYDNYLDVLNIFPSLFDYTLGRTYIACITLLIPRFLMPNKNDYMTGGEYFKYIKHHDHIRVGERFTFPGECYMNFSFIGIILGLFLVLIILKYADSLYIKRNNFIYQSFSYFFMGFTVSLLAGDTASAFSASFISLIVLIIIVYLLSQLIVKRSTCNDIT